MIPLPAHRTLLILTALVIATACGGSGADGAQSPTPSAGGETPGQAIRDTGAQPLGPEVLAAYLPESVLDLPRQPAEVNLAPGRTDGGRTFPAEAKVPYGSRPGDVVQVTISDMAGSGAYLDGQREIFATRLAGDMPEPEGETDVRRLEDGTILVTRVNGNAFQPAMELLVADRFRVEVTRRRDGSPVASDRPAVERLVALYESGSLGGLATAGDRPLTAAAWLDAPERAAVAGELGSCDEILPAEEVARICGLAAAEARPTPGMEESGSCNRRYVAPSGGSGLVFMLTRYGGSSGESQARGAATLGDEPGEFAVEHDLLPELGDGGSRSHNSGGATPDDYRLRFSQGDVLIELNATDSPFDAPEQKICTDLAQLTEIAEGISARLTSGR